MSLNQSRADKSESSQYRKSSRSGSFNLQRNSGGRGKGGGGAPAPPTSWSPSLSSNQSKGSTMTTRSGKPFRGRLTVNQRDEMQFWITEQLNGISIRMTNLETRIVQPLNNAAAHEQGEAAIEGHVENERVAKVQVPNPPPARELPMPKWAREVLEREQYEKYDTAGDITKKVKMEVPDFEDCIVQNGAHFQPPLHGAADAPLIGANVKPTDVLTQKSTRPIPKVPSSTAATVMSDTTAPTTPAKAPADASQSFPLHFGSISPGFMNGMKIPAQISSAPPNLDEQKRDQARHELLRAGLTLPMPSIPIPKQQLPRKDAGTVDQSNIDETNPTPKVKKGVEVSAASHVVKTQKPSVHTIPGISMQIPFHQPQVPSQSNTGETNPTPKVKRDVQVSVASPVVQTQKPSVHPIPGVSLQIPFHQPHVPIQFGGSSPQIESQGMTGTSLLMPMPLHSQMGNPPQVQQPVFVPGLQPHPMQTQGIMHQGHGLNFSSSMGPQLPSQLGNLGIGITQQQAGNFGSTRKTVKSTHLDTHEELRLDGSQGGVQRNDPDSDRWQRATSFQKGLIPSPHTPSQVMHKAEKKYEVGKVTDEEQAKQRQLKGILKKLTPQNFEKLFEQVKQVKIDNAVTLTGVVSQIFDKALMEPTFCEMYANFCSHLAGDLPDLNVGNEKITFKRLLLNKCQEEFERGEREQEEANKADEEGDVKQSEQEREEKRIQARRRMLGNIRLIGELYKKKMLTERIMHECITKLLGQPQNPDEEDVEALCVLMSTIGAMIDHPKAKEHMDAYFDMMARLSNNMKLSSRVRLMLKDAIDLRKNKWQQRRKVEGPKKI